LPAPGPELAALSDAEAKATRRPPGLPLDALGNAIEDEVRYVGDQAVRMTGPVQGALPGGVASAGVTGHTDESGVPVLLPLPEGGTTR